MQDSIKLLIQELAKNLSNSGSVEGMFKALKPVDHVMDNKPSDKEDYSFFCHFKLEDDIIKGSSNMRDLNLIKVDDKNLYAKMIELGKTDFVSYLNKEMFNYINGQYESSKDLGVTDQDNIWYLSNSKFGKWLQINEIEQTDVEDHKIFTNDALWAIADDLRDLKKKGQFSSYKEAYQWGARNYIKPGVSITADSLKKAFHKAKSEGRVRSSPNERLDNNYSKVKSKGEVRSETNSTASTPFMITIAMRKNLKGLGYSKEDISEMTPNKAHKIIKKGVFKKSS